MQSTDLEINKNPNSKISWLMCKIVKIIGVSALRPISSFTDSPFKFFDIPEGGGYSPIKMTTVLVGNFRKHP